MSRPVWRLLKAVMGLKSPARAGPELDLELEQFYESQLSAAGPVQRYVLLAFDRYHQRDGLATAWPRTRRDRGSDIYTSNSLIRQLCEAQPQRFLFGASVHPYRARAVELIREVRQAGACLLKWLPLHQNIDIADPRTVEALRACAELLLPLLIHYGDEFSLQTQHPEYRAVDGLLATLRSLRKGGCMPTVIVAHVATPVGGWGDASAHRALIHALETEFADAPLYADISALTSWGKVRFLRNLARRVDLHHKLLFGSDFPIPVALPRLRRELGSDYAGVRANRSWPQRAALTCLRMGFSEIVFRRWERLLASEPHFDGARSSG